ncbi:DUF2842 domain-containing protein [Devosia nitrariae]|uniref:DUF2842 domain-containing protein n=1 Tax=Devosia nitrariae TaxID=2071872 RepID=A0ABQ5W8H4_9HYPH|nr:DUF2842 domain-containing protein [Devosia nitrariae]GLQ56338.1 hypothetical protein GCM10010862_35970 [Devosia nitrariae]
MTQSNRKLLGTFLLVGSIVAWAVLATALYLVALVDMPWWVHIAYFCIAGFGWLWPAMVIIAWMARPDSAR